MNITKANPLSGYRMELEFDDGVRGVVDLSGYAGVGVFEAWPKPGFFQQLTITNLGAPAWPGDLDLCPDALYLKLTGKSAEAVFPSIRHRFACA